MFYSRFGSFWKFCSVSSWNIYQIAKYIFFNTSAYNNKLCFSIKLLVIDGGKIFTNLKKEENVFSNLYNWTKNEWMQKKNKNVNFNSAIT